MNSARMEWVEIIEPRTKEHMYANLTTGECVWDPPEDVPIKRTDSSQWWELFDSNTRRFYYYNATTQRTVWHRPSKCDIIPLAKLQTLKQNTDPNDRKENSTQTQLHHQETTRQKLPQSTKFCSTLLTHKNQISKSCGESFPTEIKSTPRGRLSVHVSEPGCPTSSISRPLSQQQCSSRRAQGSGFHQKEPDKSSDSTPQGNWHSKNGSKSFYRNDGIGDISLDFLKKQPNNKDITKVLNNENFQNSANAQNLRNISLLNVKHSPHSYQEREQKPEHQSLKDNLPSCCASTKCSGLVSPINLCRAPQPKRTYCSDGSAELEQHPPFLNQNQPNQYKQRDCVNERAEEGKLSLVRSNSFMSCITSKADQPSKSFRKSSDEYNGPASDDSMHEKYFKSVDSTPLSRRRRTTTTKAACSRSINKENYPGNISPQSPSTQESKRKSEKCENLQNVPASRSLHSPAASSTCSTIHNVGLPQEDFNSNATSHIQTKFYKNDFCCSLEQLNLDKLYLGHTTNSSKNLTKTSLNNYPSLDNIFLNTHSSRGSNDLHKKKHRSSLEKKHQQPHYRSIGSIRENTSNVKIKKKHSSSRKCDKELKSRKRFQRQSNHYLNSGDNSDAENDYGNISPLYSNWDLDMQEHLLPLKDYIIEQAKLSGQYVFGNPIDSDSYHSDSQSEHSLTGHEPDNEDSDGGSNLHVGYLKHNYGLIGNYSNMGDSVSYYPSDLSGREEISDNVETVLEAIGGEHLSEKSKSLGQDGNHDTAENVFSANHQNTQQPIYQPHFKHHQNSQLRLQKQQEQSHPKSYTNITVYSTEPPLNQTLNYSDNEGKLSQTLQSPNRHISRTSQSSGSFVGITSCFKDATLLHLPYFTKEDSANKPSTFRKLNSNVTLESYNCRGSVPLSPPPSVKKSMQQIFPKSELITEELGVSTLACMKECDIEKFAADNLNLHSKGIFRKKSSVRDMLRWTAESINRPMLALSCDKTDKKTAIELFKLIQIYMGDRKARAGMSLNSVAIDIINLSLPQQQLCDELYVQLCRQTTENPKRESLIRGWELMVVCLSFVPPSLTFQPILLNYINRHRDPTFSASFPEVGKWPIHVQISHYATICCRRINRMGSNGRRHAKKSTEDDVEQARNQIFRNSMFGNTLSEVMELQKDKFPYKKLPWIQTTLSEHVLLLNGTQTEGIFRVSADVDEVNYLKSQFDRWEIPDYKNSIADAHAPASLLKLWYRELYDPLIPDILYDECIDTEDPLKAKEIVNKLPDLNKLVLTYLVHFLQKFSHPDVVTCTKMDSSNLAMVFAPNCLRCTSDDPKIILKNARKEMAFVHTLIQHMDTAHVANMQ